MSRHSIAVAALSFLEVNDMPEYKNSDMDNVIKEYVRRPRYKQVLRLRYCEGLSYEEIGEITSYSTQHVKHICKSHKDILFRHL